MTPLWSDKREETHFATDDLGIQLERVCDELKAEYRERGFENLRGVVAAGMFDVGDGYELCGSQLGGNVSITLMLAMLLHSELHDAGIRGGEICAVLELIERDMRARLEAQG